MSADIQSKLSQCDKLQQQLWAYRPLSDETLKSLREYYRVGLTYTSNALEGNSLTESETKVIKGKRALKRIIPALTGNNIRRSGECAEASKEV